MVATETPSTRRLPHLDSSQKVVSCGHPLSREGHGFYILKRKEINVATRLHQRVCLSLDSGSTLVVARSQASPHLADGWGWGAGNDQPQMLGG